MSQIRTSRPGLAKISILLTGVLFYAYTSDFTGAEHEVAEVGVNSVEKSVVNVVANGEIDSVATEENVLPEIRTSLLDITQHDLLEWAYTADGLEGIIKMADFEKPVWFSATEHEDAWYLKQIAFLGEYVVYIGDFESFIGFREVESIATTIETNSVLALIELPIENLAEAQAVHNWLMSMDLGSDLDRNSLVFPAAAPNDPSYSGSWEMAKLEMEPVWERFGFQPHLPHGRRMVIAVVDDGANQSDLDPWVNPSEVAGNGVDDDSNGYVDDVNGWNFATNSNDVFSYAGGHGTTVSRIAASLSNNGSGTASAASSAVLMRAIHTQTSIASHYVSLGAMYYAAMNGADVVNCSWVSTSNASVPWTLQEGAKKNVMFVAAAGNDNRDLAVWGRYPARSQEPNIITVGASTSSDTRSGSSNYGVNWVHLFAPANATSFAAPLVSSTVALLKALKPDAHFSEIKAAILNGVDPVASLSGICISGGRLNARGAVEAFMEIDLSSAPVAPVPPLPEPEITGVDTSSVQLSLNLLSSDAILEVQLSRNGSEYVALAAENYVFDGSGITIKRLLEGSFYQFRFRTILNEVASEWIESEIVRTNVYVERTPITALPLHYYDFNRADSGIANDFGSMAAHLDISSLNPIPSLDGNHAVDFSSSSKGLKLPSAHATDGLTTARTVSLWIRTSSKSVNSTSLIFEDGDSLQGLNLVLDKGHLIAQHWNRTLQGAASQLTILTGGLLTVGEWTHIALVLDTNGALNPEGLVLYVNGQIVAQGSAFPVFEWASESGVGQVNGSTLYNGRISRRFAPLNAAMDNLSVWESALSLEMIQDLILRSF